MYFPFASLTVGLLSGKRLPLLCMGLEDLTTPNKSWHCSPSFSTAEGAGTTFTYGVGPLARYYFGAAEVNTTTTSARRSSRFFLEGTVGLQAVNVPGGSSTNGLGIGIGPGLAYFVTENIALEGLLKYTKAFGFGNDGGSSLLQLGVGFQIYLPAVPSATRRIRSASNRLCIPASAILIAQAKV
jgi:hypothetical protein